MIEILIVAVGFFVAWNIGANNTANCVGLPVGGQVLSYRRAVAIVVVFVFLGAFLEGWRNMGTVGQGIVLPGTGGANPLASVPVVALASLLAAGLWMSLATYFGLPMSVSLSTVGAVMGAGALLSLARPDLGVTLNYGKIGAIAVSWLLNPLFAALASYLVFRAVSSATRRIRNVLRVNQVLTILIIIASAYSAYALGANDVGTSVGAVYAFFGGSPQPIALFGAAALAVGAVTFSRRVMATVGSGIARIGPVTALAAQLGAAITVWSFVQFGMPVSTSEAIVAGVAGMGFFKGTLTVEKGQLNKVALALVVTPAAVFLLSFAIGGGLLAL